MRSNAMRMSAKGEECTFQIPGVCNGNPETTVLCHLPDESHGMGHKADDISAAYGCVSCHDALDGRNTQARAQLDEWALADWYMRRAQTRTLRRMIEKGIVKIAGLKS
jgi:hypothetical protein